MNVFNKVTLQSLKKNKTRTIVTIIGIFAGAFCLNLIDKIVPHLHKMMGPDIEDHNNANLSNNL